MSVAITRNGDTGSMEPNVGIGQARVGLLKEPGLVMGLLLQTSRS